MTVLIKKTDHPLWSEGYNRAIEDMRTADPVTIPRAHYEALMGVARVLETEHDFDESEVDSCPWCKAIVALRAAGIQTGE